MPAKLALLLCPVDVDLAAKGDGLDTARLRKQKHRIQCRRLLLVSSGKLSNTYGEQIRNFGPLKVETYVLNSLVWMDFDRLRVKPARP